jgi:hypothetical protein
VSYLHSVPSSTAEDLAAQDASLDVACPRCHVERDACCRNTELGTPMRASHFQRIQAANATTGGPA